MSLNTQFHPLRVAEVRRETPDAVSIVFEIPADLVYAYKFDAGQFLTLKMDIGGEEVHRNYSLCVPPAGGPKRGSLTGGIAREPDRWTAARTFVRHSCSSRAAVASSAPALSQRTPAQPDKRTS